MDIENKRRKTISSEDKNSFQFDCFDYEEIFKKKQRVSSTKNLPVQEKTPSVSKTEKLGKVIKRNLLKNINDEKAKGIKLRKEQRRMSQLPSKGKEDQFQEVQIFTRKYSDNVFEDKNIRTSNVRINNYFDSSLRISKNPEQNQKTPIEKIEDDTRKLIKTNNVFESMSNKSHDDDEDIPFPLILSIKGNFKRTLNNINFICILYSLIVTAYINSFLRTTILNYFEMCVEILIDCVFIFEIFFSLLTPYLDHEENLQSGFLKIFFNYSKGYIIPDLICAIPYSSIIFYSQIKNYGYESYRIIQLYSWIRVILIFKINKNNVLDDLMETKIFDDAKIKRLVNFLVYFFLLVHYISCFWIFLGKFIEIFSNLNWIGVNSSISDLSNSQLYVASIYFNLVTVYTIGYGDIVSINIPEKVFNSILLMFGTLIFSYAVSNFSTLLLFDEKKSMIQMKKKIMEDINEEFSIGYKLYSKCTRYIKLSLDKVDEDRHNFLDILPNKLKNDLVLLMYRKYISEHNFFKGKSNDFILFVLPLLKQHNLEKDEKLFSVGENVEEIYLVIRGRLSLEFKSKSGDIEIWQFGINTYFGEFLINDISPYNLKAKSETVQVLVLKKKDFIQIKQNFPDTILSILNSSLITLEQIKNRKKVIQEIIKIDDDLESVKTKIKAINQYLTIRDFDRYYYENIDFMGVFDFIVNEDPKIIKQIFQLKIGGIKSSKSKMDKYETYKKIQTIVHPQALREREKTNTIGIEKTSTKNIIEPHESNTTFIIKEIEIRNINSNYNNSFGSINSNKLKNVKTRKTENKDEIQPRGSTKIRGSIGNNKIPANRNFKKFRTKGNLASFQNLLKKIDVNEAQLNYLKEENELAIRAKILISDSYGTENLFSRKNTNKSFNLNMHFDKFNHEFSSFNQNKSFNTLRRGGKDFTDKFSNRSNSEYSQELIISGFSFEIKNSVNKEELNKKCSCDLVSTRNESFEILIRKEKKAKSKRKIHKKKSQKFYFQDLIKKNSKIIEYCQDLEVSDEVIVSKLDKLINMVEKKTN